MRASVAICGDDVTLAALDARHGAPRGAPRRRVHPSRAPLSPLPFPRVTGYDALLVSFFFFRPCLRKNKRKAAPEHRTTCAPPRHLGNRLGTTTCSSRHNTRVR